MQTQNLNYVIDHLAAKLSVPAAHLWDVLVRQQQIEAVQDGVIIVLAIAAAVFVWRLYPAMKMWVEAGEKWSDRDVGMGFYYAARVIIPVIAFFVVAACASELIGMLMNPEFYALKQILTAVKP